MIFGKFGLATGFSLSFGAEISLVTFAQAYQFEMFTNLRIVVAPPKVHLPMF